MNNVIANRAARIAFGIVLLAGALALAVFAVGPEGSHTLFGLHAWQLLAGSWLVAAVAALLVRAVVVMLPRPRNNDALRRAALSVPAVGIALLLPLTLHLPFADNVDSFDEWVTISLWIVGHVHIVFAFLVMQRARALTGLSPSMTVKRVFVLTCFWAAIPFVGPALFVAVTGIPIIPLLIWMEKIAKADRDASHDVPFAIARIA